MKKLSKRQRDVLGAVRTLTRPCSPTHAEIARAIGISSTNGIGGHLLALERKGYIRRRYDRGNRNYDIIRSSDE